MLAINILSSKLSTSLTKFSFCQALVPLHEAVPSVLSTAGLELSTKVAYLQL